MTMTDEEIEARWSLQRSKAIVKQAFSSLDTAPGDPLAKCLLELMDKADEATRLITERAEARGVE